MTQDTVGSRKIILLVDDDIQFLSVGQELLEYFGFQALTASHATEALQIFRRRQQKIDLVIMDSNLPHIDGYQLLHQLQAIVPQVKVIIASGFFGQKDLDKFQHAGVAGMIQKPFRAGQLQTEIFKVLEE